MQKENLLRTLEKYESPVEDSEQLENNLQTIINDLNRIDFSFSDIKDNQYILKFYLFILEKSFKSLPIAYFQGMMEVGTVLIDIYFQDASFKLKNQVLKSKSCENLIKNGCAVERIHLNDLSDSDRAIFRDALEKNDEIYRKYKNSLVNILNEKFLFLTVNNFEKYNKYNAKFVNMMNSTLPNHKQLNEMESFKFMNHTLTFFKRLSRNSKVLYTIYNLILNSNISMIFAILSFYLDKASKFSGTNLIITEENRSKYLISEISESDIKKILKINDTFRKGKFNKKPRILTDIYIFGIFLGALVISWIISRFKN
jgi:hypothetical protein